MSTPVPVPAANGNGTSKLLGAFIKNPAQVVILLIVLAMAGVSVKDLLGGTSGDTSQRLARIEAELAAQPEAVPRREHDQAIERIRDDLRDLKADIAELRSLLLQLKDPKP